jgi:hypothetical protein
VSGADERFAAAMVARERTHCAACLPLIEKLIGLHERQLRLLETIAAEAGAVRVRRLRFPDEEPDGLAERGA